MEVQSENVDLYLLTVEILRYLLLADNSYIIIVNNNQRGCTAERAIEQAGDTVWSNR